MWLASQGWLFAVGDDNATSDIGLEDSAVVRELVVPFTMLPKAGRSCRDLPRLINAGELKVKVNGRPAVISSWELAGVTSSDGSAQERVDALDAPPARLVVLFDQYYFHTQIALNKGGSSRTLTQSGADEERWRRAFESIRDYLRDSFRDRVDEILLGVVRDIPRYYGKPTKQRAEALEYLARLEHDAGATDPTLITIDATSCASAERSIRLKEEQWWERMHLMIQALEFLPGQKDIVFVSDSPPASPGSTLELSQLGRMLGRASAVLHTLDLHGTDLRLESVAPGGFRALADFGGGQAFANELANLKVVTAVLQEQAPCRGALFVKPPAPTRHRPSDEIRVSYEGLDFTLFTPKQYATSEILPRDTTDIAMMTLGHVARGAELELNLLLLDGAARKATWNGLVLLKLQALDEPFGGYAKHLAIEVGAVQLKGKKSILGRRIELGEAELERDFLEPRAARIYGYPVKVSAGMVHLLASAIDEPAEVKAMHREELVVPSRVSRQVVIGSDVASIGGLRVILPRMDRRFEVGKPVRVFTTQPGKQPAIAATLIDRTGQQIELQLQREGETPDHWSSYYIELNGLAEGRWKLRLTDTDSPSELDFEIGSLER